MDAPNSSKTADTWLNTAAPSVQLTSLAGSGTVATNFNGYGTGCKTQEMRERGSTFFKVLCPNASNGCGKTSLITATVPPKRQVDMF